MEQPTLFVIGQCQRCGRGFLNRTGGRDGYYHPKLVGERGRYLPSGKKECRGHILPLASPVPILAFENYGPLLPTATQAQEPK